MAQFYILVMLCTAVGGKIQGIVKDEDSGKPIPYAHVSVLNTQIGAATAEDGTFFVLSIAPGSYTVEFSHMGYQTKLVKDVIVEINQTVRLEITLKQSPIEIAPVTVISKTPLVSKDMTGTTYIIRKAELAMLPIDYTVELIAFQPSVARLDTGLHVRGGRVTEVLYMIDNVSIIDPHTGDPVLSMPKGVLNEVIFLPGGYDIEYGRAMSGVVNLITEHPLERLHTRAYGKSERIMPYDYNFGYENYQGSVHLPVSRKFKGLFSFDLMHTNDWNPRLHVLPHKQRDDYTLYGKWLFAPSGKWRLTLSGAKSRVQFDRYDTQWKFNLNHYRSDLIDGNLQAANLSFLPDSRKLFNITLSRLHATKIYGVREWGPYGLFENFTFKDSSAIKWPTYSVRNPYGADFYVEGNIPLYNYPLTDGDYPEYRRRSSNVLSTKGYARIQVHKYHEVKAGFEYASMELKNFNQFVPNKYLLFGREYKLTDEYTFYPREYSMFVQDNIDYKGLYARVGLRYDRFAAGVDGVEPEAIISPRCGASFMVTEKFLFRTNIGLYTQPPLYDYLYSYHNILPLPSHLETYLPLVGNPNLNPEKTMSYEIGLQGAINENLGATINIFYKDVSDLIGTRFIPAAPRDYVRYENVEYANIRGMEMIVEFAHSLFAGKASYTLSWARGTSSYAEEVYDILDWYESYDTITYHAEEYYLNFDQRHRIFVQGVLNLPMQTKFHVFGYLGSGFPYTPPGEEGMTEERNALRLEFQKQVDCVLSKSFRIGRSSLNLSVEILNLLGERYQIRRHGPLIRYANIDYQDFYRYYFNHIYSVADKYYAPPADKNHDGIVTPSEQYEAFLGLVAESDDWVNAYSAPRRARLGLSLAL
jgi:hypothetical protein